MSLSEKPRVSVIMVDGSYRPGYYAVDSFEKQTIPKDEYELIWVEYYDKVANELSSKLNNYKNLHLITLSKGGTYHSSYCFNAGILASKADLLIIPDGDVIVEEDFIEKICQHHQENDKLVMYIHRFEEPKESFQSDINIERLRKTVRFNNPSNYGGCITVRKKWLLAINGYEQHSIFQTGGYHANGLDVYTRLKNLGLHIMWHPKLALYHPWHPAGEGADFFYSRQRIMINYRSIQRSTLPFQGIDPSKNSPPPQDLMQKLETFSKRDSRFIRLTKKIHNIIKAL